MQQGRPSTAAYVKINVYIDCNRWSENSHCLLDCLFMTFIVHTSPALYVLRRPFYFPAAAILPNYRQHRCPICHCLTRRFPTHCPHAPPDTFPQPGLPYLISVSTLCFPPLLPLPNGFYTGNGKAGSSRSRSHYPIPSVTHQKSTPIPNGGVLS